MKKFTALLLAMSMLLVFTACGKSSTRSDSSGESKMEESKTEESGSQNTENNISDASIKQIYISNFYIIALNGKGELYAIGENSYNEFGLGEDAPVNIDKVTQIAVNVQKFTSKNSYIDNNNDLFVAGIKHTGGQYDVFTKLYSNVKDACSLYAGMGTAIIDDNNDAYYILSSFATKDSDGAFGETTDEFKKYASDVKYLLSGRDFNGYVDGNGQLFTKKSGDAEYSKILDNVNNYAPISYGLSGYKLLTDDNEYYTYCYDYDSSEYKLNKIAENVVDFGGGFYKTQDGKYYVGISENISYDHIKQIVIEDETSEFALLNISDIKELLFEDVNRGIFVYINEEGKLVLIRENEEKKVDYKIDSLKDIYETVKY